MHSSKSARSVLPLFTLALATGVEVGIVGSWVSTVAAAAVSRLALATFAFTLALAFRINSKTQLKRGGSFKTQLNYQF